MLNQIDLSRADLNLLVLFETVMRERHVGRAAERLNLSPSAVSHGLTRLRALLSDPLFIKTPRGVTPTDRALALEARVADILARVRNVVFISAPFAAATSTRSFTIGAPDGVSAVFLQPLLKQLKHAAPGVDIRIRQLLPRPGETSPDSVWRDAYGELDGRAMDLAVIPIDSAPPRFAVRKLFDEEFVIAARAGHAWLKTPTLARFCAAKHLVVSMTGDPVGFVDTALAERKLSRRVALTVPNFVLAAAALADTDLISALPRRFVDLFGPRFKLASAKSPIALPKFTLNIVTPKPALQDAGIAWLIDVLAEIGAPRARRAGT